MSAYSRQRRGRDTRIVGRATTGHRYLTAGAEITPEQQHAAARAVAGWAYDHGGPDVARELLGMLGIDHAR